MKFSIKIFSVALILLFSLGCSEDNLEITSPQDFELLTPQASNINLNFAFPDNPAFTLAWTDNLTNSGSYSIEMAATSEFAAPIALGTSSTNTFTMTVANFNMSLIGAGINAYENTNVFMRIKAGEQTSNTVVFSVNSYPETPPVFTNPSSGTSVVLSIASPDETAMVFEWEDPDFNLASTQATITYEIESALAGTSFADIASLGSISDELSLSVSHSDLNAAAITAGILPEEVGSLDIRIKATIATASGNLVRYSGSISIDVTPYSESFPFLYFVGDATTPGWNNNNNNTPVFRNQNIPNKYVYTGYFNSGAFKLLETLGQWQPQWGTNDGSTLAVNTGSGSDPGTFNVSAAGYYTYTFTTVGEGGSFTVAPYDASGAPTYGSIAIIGDATPNGWDGDNDTNLNQDPNNPHLWFLNGVNLTNGGQMLIRANDMWNDVWRYTGSSEDYYGTSVLAGGGDNIPFNGESGTYDVWFNDLDGSYVFIPNN